MSKTSAGSGGRVSRHRAGKTLDKARRLNHETDLHAMPAVVRQRHMYTSRISILEKENRRLRKELLRATNKLMNWFHAFQPACTLAVEISEMLDATPRLIKFRTQRSKAFSGRLFTFLLGGAVICTIEIWDGPAHIRVTRTDDAPPFLLTAPGNKLGGPEKVALAEYLEARLSLSV